VIKYFILKILCNKKKKIEEIKDIEVKSDEYDDNLNEIDQI